jgi:osmotically-inducible protein OsmY
MKIILFSALVGTTAFFTGACSQQTQDRAQATADSAAADAQQNAQDAKQASENAADRAGDAAERAGDSAADAAKDTGDAIKDAAKDVGQFAKDSAKSAGDVAKDSASSAASAADAAVQTVDVKTALIADKRVDASGIDVDTNHRTKTVVLKGHVPSASQKTIAGQIASDHAKGYNVRNELTIRG